MTNKELCMNLYSTVFCLFLMPPSVYAHHTCVPLPMCKGMLSKPANVHVANMRSHQSIRPAQQNAWPCFLFLGCQCLETEQTEAQGRKCEGCLSWLDLGVCSCVCVYVWVSVCVCTHLCGAPHQKTTEWLSCYDLWPWHAPRQREGGGGGEKDTVKQSHTGTSVRLHTHTHTHKHIQKEKGGIHSI